MEKRTYTIQVTVEEGNDEFWEGFDPDTGKRRGYASMDEVLDLVEQVLTDGQLDVISVKPVKLETKYD